jgi:hypothetical protein
MGEEGTDYRPAMAGSAKSLSYFRPSFSVPRNAFGLVSVAICDSQMDRRRHDKPQSQAGYESKEAPASR